MECSGGLLMRVHIRAQCLRGRDWACSLSAWLNRREQARNSGDRLTCSSAAMLSPTQTHQSAIDCKNVTGQPEETNTTNVEIQRDYRKLVVWQEKRNIVFVYFFTWAFHCFWGSDLKHYRANISLMEKRKTKKKLYSVNYVQFLYSLTNVFLLPSR